MAALVLQAQRDTFAIHASDGLWGAVADQEAVDVVRRVVEQFTLMKSLGSNNRQVRACVRQALVAARWLGPGEQGGGALWLSRWYGSGQAATSREMHVRSVSLAAPWSSLY